MTDRNPAPLPAAFLPDERLVLRRIPLVQRYEAAYAARLLREGSVLRSALYDAGGRLIRLSQRRSGADGDILTNGDPERIERPGAVKTVEGRGLYIGNVFAHYGHFITEGLGATWYALQQRDFDYYAAHHFIFGDTIEPYAAHCYRALGIDPSRILVVKEPTVYASLTVPERGWDLNIRALSACGAVFHRLRATCAASAGRAIKLYLSRAGIDNRKVISNEEEMEQVFRARGFTAVRPETLPFPEQLSLYRRAQVIAGLSGSALHNVLFSAFGTAVIAIGNGRSRDVPSRNQRICSTLVGGPIHMVPFKVRDGGFDLDHLRWYLDALGV